MTLTPNHQPWKKQCKAKKRRKCSTRDSTTGWTWSVRRTRLLCCSVWSWCKTGMLMMDRREPRPPGDTGKMESSKQKEQNNRYVTFSRSSYREQGRNRFLNLLALLIEWMNVNHLLGTKFRRLFNPARGNHPVKSGSDSGSLPARMDRRYGSQTRGHAYMNKFEILLHAIYSLRPNKTKTTLFQCESL